VTLRVRWAASAYLRTNYNYWYIDPSSPSATTDTGRKFGRGCAPLVIAGSHSDTISHGPRPRLPLYQVAS